MNTHLYPLHPINNIVNKFHPLHRKVSTICRFRIIVISFCQRIWNNIEKAKITTENCLQKINLFHLCSRCARVLCDPRWKIHMNGCYFWNYILMYSQCLKRDCIAQLHARQHVQGEKEKKSTESTNTERINSLSLKKYPAIINLFFFFGVWWLNYSMCFKQK